MSTSGCPLPVSKSEAGRPGPSATKNSAVGGMSRAMPVISR
ncbi:hypothetical protein ABZX30_12405 [Streptomyces sp. NPDC004542]